MATKPVFYITTPIYYPNDVPHIGHAYTTIAADVLARYHRSLGDDVLFTTGTDEHGQKIEEAAKKAGKETKEFVDELILRFKDAWKILDISYDDFIRTTESRHKDAVVEIINRCNNNGDIFKGFYEGLYCTGCEAYYLEKDLDSDGKCKIHKVKAQIVKEESYFFKLSAYQEKLLNYYESNPDFLSPKHKREEIINRVKEGLIDLSITRTSFKWGIPFPLDKNHITYVWFDALTNYITCAGFPTDTKKFEEYWPCNVHLVGKDIMWFHEVIWPAMLMSANLSLPKKVFAHGWWTVDGEKMSKSIGNVISPVDLAKKYGTDELRYFLLKEASFGEDGDYSEKSFIQRINSDLADDLGNLLSRTLTLIEKNFNKEIPHRGELERIDDELIKNLDIATDYDNYMNSLEFNNVLSIIWRVISHVNKYVNDTKPWQIEDKKRLSTVLYNVSESLRIISIYIDPFMPTKAYEVRLAFDLKNESFKTLRHHLKPNSEVVKGKHLFNKFELKSIHAKKLESVKEKKVVDENIELDFSILNLKVGKIVDITKHPNADKLYVEKIDFGTETRQILSGLVPWYKPEELLGKKVVVVTNLKTSKIRGLESQGMLLAGEEDNNVGILFLENSELGKQVLTKGLAPNDKEITFDEFLKVKMEVENGVAKCGGYELKAGDETVYAEKIKNGRIR